MLTSQSTMEGVGPVKKLGPRGIKGTHPFHSILLSHDMSLTYCMLQVINLVGVHKRSLHPVDMLLLANFVWSFESVSQGQTYFLILCQLSYLLCH